jgi:hypothetical protein
LSLLYLLFAAQEWAAKPPREPGMWRKFLQVSDFVHLNGASYRVARDPLAAKKKPAYQRDGSSATLATASGDASVASDDHDADSSTAMESRKVDKTADNSGEGGGGEGGASRKKKRRRLSMASSVKEEGGSIGSSVKKKKQSSRPSSGGLADYSGGSDQADGNESGPNGVKNKPQEVRNPWGLEQEVREEATDDHILLDHPWMLEDAYNVEVYKMLPHVFYAKPFHFLKRQIVASYPVQKSAAISAITLHKYAGFLQWLMTNFDEDSDYYATLKRKTSRVQEHRDQWLQVSRTIVQMSFDFTIRRQVFGILYKVLGASVSFVKLLRGVFKTISKGGNNETPFEYWQRSMTKLDVVCILDKGNDHTTVLGEFKLDMKAPADVMREMIQRNFRLQLNPTIGDSFLFLKIDPDTSKESVLSRENEFKTYCSEYCFEKTDNKTMVTSMTILITPDPNRGRVIIPEFEAKKEDPEDELDQELENLLK